LVILACLGVTCVVATAIGGCVFAGDPANPVGALRVGGEPALSVFLCKGERVESVYLTDSDDDDGEGPLLWRIDAVGGPVAMDTFVVGDVPPGFREVRGLQPMALRRPVTAWVIADVELVGLVDFSEVHEDTLYIDLKPASESELADGRSC
jgi:hypothetical protein